MQSVFSLHDYYQSVNYSQGNLLKALFATRDNRDYNQCSHSVPSVEHKIILALV